MADKWKLIYVPSGEMVCFGDYSLCRFKLNELPNKTGYKIVPFTFKMNYHARV